MKWSLPSPPSPPPPYGIRSITLNIIKIFSLPDSVVDPDQSWIRIRNKSFRIHNTAPDHMLGTLPTYGHGIIEHTLSKHQSMQRHIHIEITETIQKFIS